MAFSGEWAEARGEWFSAFLEENNRLSGEQRAANELETEAVLSFLELGEVGVEDLSRLVEAYAPDAVLRDRSELDVEGGGHDAPLGGPDVVDGLRSLLEQVNASQISAHAAHCAYSALQPFVDANGRSGRILWLWQMEQMGQDVHHALGFAQAFYHQTLAESGNAASATQPVAPARQAPPVQRTEPAHEPSPAPPPAPEAEREPPPPSTERATTGGTAPSAAAQRLIERAKRRARGN